MRFLSIAFLCVLAGCSMRSEQPKLTYVPFAAQGSPGTGTASVSNQAVVPQTCPCTCSMQGANSVPPMYMAQASYAPQQVDVMPVQNVPQVNTASLQMVPQQASVVAETPQSPADYLLPKEDYYPTQPAVIEAPLQSSDIIVILQHAVQRDLVKCSASDLRCISGYEMQGYVQLSQTPSVPVSVEQKYDVLDGKWSDSANVPRW